MKPLSTYARICASATHLLLTCGLIAWSGSWLGLLLAAVLLAPLPGLLRGREYTYAWGSLLLTFYSAGLLADGVATPAHKSIAWALAAVAAVEFCALTLYVRLRSRERAAAAGFAAAASSPVAQKAE